jgi:phosphoglucomutase
LPPSSFTSTTVRPGGIKPITDQGWFAARSSGTEAVLKIYAESFKGPTPLHRIQEEAYAIIQTAAATEAQG